MPVGWSKKQRARVNAAIRRYPVSGGGCALLARRIHPTARELDPGAAALHITPRPPARRIRPLADIPSWEYHVTTTVSEHCVDALTGADGALEVHYLARYFESPEALLVERKMPWSVRP